MSRKPRQCPPTGHWPSRPPPRRPPPVWQRPPHARHRRPGGTAPAAAAATLFDDFNYSGHTDPKLSEHGWTVRSNAGGPGVPGATWAPENITFATDGRQLRHEPGDFDRRHRRSPPKQTEILTKAMKFKNGTYAARVKFTDAPKSGPDGDHLVQTFFTINDLKAPMADDYAEYDFEYLPNGGWGEPGNILYTTSWETYKPDPWEAVNQHTESRQSFTRAGTTWCSPSTTAPSSTTSTGSSSARTTPSTCPSGPMSINFNQWLIDLAGQTSTTRARLRPAGRLRPARQGPGPHPGPGGRQDRRLPQRGHHLRGHRPGG